MTGRPQTCFCGNCSVCANRNWRRRMRAGLERLGFIEPKDRLSYFARGIYLLELHWHSALSRNARHRVVNGMSSARRERLAAGSE